MDYSEERKRGSTINFNSDIDILRLIDRKWFLLQNMINWNIDGI